MPKENVVSTLSLPLKHDTPVSHALATGVAISATVATFYALCTLAWIVAPDAFMGFMNSLFHGLNFNALVKPGRFSPTGFLEALLVMGAWSFLAGTFYGWLRQRLGA
jgi:hypothetical protein